MPQFNRKSSNFKIADIAVLHLLDSFDFHKVYKAMIATDHKWYKEGKYYQPSIKNLKGKARDLCRRLQKERSASWVASGGFVVYRDFDGETESVNLEFIVEYQNLRIYETIDATI